MQDIDNTSSLSADFEEFSFSVFRYEDENTWNLSVTDLLVEGDTAPITNYLQITDFESQAVAMHYAELKMDALIKEVRAYKLSKTEV